MATNLVMHDIDEEVARALTKRAAMNGRTEEDEHREILRSVLLQPSGRSLAEVLASMPNVGEDADFERSM